MTLGCRSPDVKDGPSSEDKIKRVTVIIVKSTDSSNEYTLLNYTIYYQNLVVF